MKESQEKISVIIAAYNEESTIAKAIKEVRAVLPESEIIVVDDGSTDGTLTEARQYENDLTKVISTPDNKGKGHAIRCGIKAATGTIMAQIDADLQFPAEGLPAIIQPILDMKADIIFGTRYRENASENRESVTFLKWLASYVMGIIISVICRQRYTDVFAGFKAWRSDVIRHINLREDDFTYEAEIAIKAKRMHYKVIEVHTAYRKRIKGKSKIRLLYHTIKITGQIFKITFAR